MSRFTTAISMIGFVLASPISMAADSLTVVSWGGAYTHSQIEAYVKPYAKQTGIHLNVEDNDGGLARIRAQAESGNVNWDVIDLMLPEVEIGCDEGLLEPIDASLLAPAPDGTPASEDFMDGTLHECGVGTIVWSTVLAYSTSRFGSEAPQKIEDLFDVGRFPGKRGLRKSPEVNIEWALMADGVPPEEVYGVLSTPEGIDRAFAVLDGIREDVIWWTSGAQPLQLLADGDVAMTSTYNGRLFNAIAAEGLPFETVWDGQVWDIDLWGIVRGSRNLKLAIDFIRFSTDTQRLADQTRWISYGPVRYSSAPLVPDDMKPHIPTSPENFQRALQHDFRWWADYGDEMRERFDAWLAR